MCKHCIGNILQQYKHDRELIVALLSTKKKVSKRKIELAKMLYSMNQDVLNRMDRLCICTLERCGVEHDDDDRNTGTQVG